MQVSSCQWNMRVAIFSFYRTLELCQHSNNSGKFQWHIGALTHLQSESVFDGRQKKLLAIMVLDLNAQHQESFFFTKNCNSLKLLNVGSIVFGNWKYFFVHSSPLTPSTQPYHFIIRHTFSLFPNVKLKMSLHIYIFSTFFCGRRLPIPFFIGADNDFSIELYIQYLKRFLRSAKWSADIHAAILLWGTFARTRVENWKLNSKRQFCRKENWKLLTLGKSRLGKTGKLGQDPIRLTRPWSWLLMLQSNSINLNSCQNFSFLNCQLYTKIYLTWIDFSCSMKSLSNKKHYAVLFVLEPTNTSKASNISSLVAVYKWRHRHF